MYWDTLTATGVIISIISALGAFFLEFHKRPDMGGGNPRNS